MISKMASCVILGSGGHGKVLLDTIRLSRAAEVIAILDRDEQKWGEALLGVQVLGGDSKLGKLKRSGVTCFAVGIGSVGDNAPRMRLFRLGVARGLKALTVVHPRAIISSEAEIGAGCQLLAGCIVNAGARLGRNVLVNSGAIVEHDVKVLEHAHVASGARLAGGVVVGKLAFVGAGATVKQGVRIGEGAVVGAGTVVLRDVPKWAVVVGVPGRILRGASPAERKKRD